MKANCTVHAFVHVSEVRHLGDLKIPTEVHDTNIIEQILNNLQRADIAECISKTCNSIAVIKLVISFLAIILDDQSNTCLC